MVNVPIGSVFACIKISVVSELGVTDVADAVDTTRLAISVLTNAKSLPFHATMKVLPLGTVTPVVGPTPRIVTPKPPTVLLITT